MQRLRYYSEAFIYSFPLQLLFNNIRRNHVLILCWIILFAMITGQFGQYLGIPYLFLDPEYLNEISFMSFFIVGNVLAGFTVAFHITCYIMDGHRFSFVGTLSRPFTKFALNNSIIPLVFIITYLYYVLSFQLNNQYTTRLELFWNMAGLVSGFALTTFVFFIYFWLTNKDIFRYVVCRIDEKLKESVQVTRASAMRKLDVARKRQVRVDNYLDYNLRIRKVDDTGFYDKSTIIQVFDQNHLNLVIIQVFIIAVVLVLGIFKDNPAFQIPAAATAVIFLTIFVMLSGAFTYWFGGWASTAGILVFIVINYLAGQDFFSKRYEAFGLDYTRPAVSYNNEYVRELHEPTQLARDRQSTLTMLENWRKKFPVGEPPKMVFLCTSGGGKRAALWTLTALQIADSISQGELFEKSIMISGASGGLIGASFFRELKLRQKQGEGINPYAIRHRSSLSSDNLNPLIYSLLVNDVFTGFNRFEYAGNTYRRDRSYTFEEQLNVITERLMDKPISSYYQPEHDALIPLLVLSPTIINDGRKLFIASHRVTYLNSVIDAYPDYALWKIAGVDFLSLFRDHGAGNLRFLSALRMSATFPYITPNTTLPTNPSIQIMDAGISDNFGISDAVRFLYAFKDWISENTSGVVVVSIRDSPKLGEIAERTSQSILDALTQPISTVYNNFENFQDISNDTYLGFAKTWFTKPIDRIDLQYQIESYAPVLSKMDSLRQNNARASLSWRLTAREKEGIVDNIYTPANVRELERLKNLLD
ncbi:MAG: patatin-like phospholipase family protein [Cyclobacteriaceae bacterium]|nr:patatin-like phospholipase family protein [Cyclobacteriaceae bacterium]